MLPRFDQSLPISNETKSKTRACSMFTTGHLTCSFEGSATGGDAAKNRADSKSTQERRGCPCPPGAGCWRGSAQVGTECRGCAPRKPCPPQGRGVLVLPGQHHRRDPRPAGARRHPGEAAAPPGAAAPSRPPRVPARTRRRCPVPPRSRSRGAALTCALGWPRGPKTGRRRAAAGTDWCSRARCPSRAAGRCGGGGRGSGRGAARPSVPPSAVRGLSPAHGEAGACRAWGASDAVSGLGREVDAPSQAGRVRRRRDKLSSRGKCRAQLGPCWQVFVRRAFPCPLQGSWRDYPAHNWAAAEILQPLLRINFHLTCYKFFGPGNGIEVTLLENCSILKKTLEILLQIPTAVWNLKDVNSSRIKDVTN